MAKVKSNFSFNGIQRVKRGVILNNIEYQGAMLLKRKTFCFYCTGHAVLSQNYLLK